MSLADCPGCWNLHCTCPNGGEWRRLDQRTLLKISAAIDAALVLGPETAEPVLVPRKAPWTDCLSLSQAPERPCGECDACKDGLS